MANIFFKNSQLVLTQPFGANADYYSNASNGRLRWHEGDDYIPKDLSDWTIYSPVNGYVWVDVDLPRDGGAYGNHIAIVAPTERLVLFFCHMSENFIEPGQWVSPEEPIGIMGNTGNVMGKKEHPDIPNYGAHVHFMLYPWYEKPDNRLDWNNGTLGMVNPGPFIREWGCEVTKR